jgi:hypothetical protein
MGGAQKIWKVSNVTFVGLESAGTGPRQREVAAGAAARRPRWRGGGCRCGRRPSRCGGGCRRGGSCGGAEADLATRRRPPAQAARALGRWPRVSLPLEAPPSSRHLQYWMRCLLSRWKEIRTRFDGWRREREIYKDHGAARPIIKRHTDRVLV